MSGHPIYLLRSRRHRLVYVENPKAASTSIHLLFLGLVDYRTDQHARKIFDDRRSAEELRSRGLSRTRVEADDVNRIVEAHGDWIWFSVVRHPYRRTLSNYHNKLSRYTRRFRPGVYWRGKAAQILRGPRAWHDHTVGIRRMQQHLSFDAFVAGLERDGTDFDQHFRSQAIQLRTASLPYRYLVKLKHLGSGLQEVLSAADVDEPHRHTLQGTRLNATEYGQPADRLLTDSARAGIGRLYHRDFETFGFRR